MPTAVLEALCPDVLGALWLDRNELEDKQLRLIHIHRLFRI